MLIQFQARFSSEPHPTPQRPYPLQLPYPSPQPRWPRRQPCSPRRAHSAGPACYYRPRFLDFFVLRLRRFSVFFVFSVGGHFSVASFPPKWAPIAAPAMGGITEENFKAVPCLLLSSNSSYSGWPGFGGNISQPRKLPIKKRGAPTNIPIAAPSIP